MRIISNRYFCWLLILDMSCAKKVHFFVLYVILRIKFTFARIGVFHIPKPAVICDTLTGLAANLIIAGNFHAMGTNNSGKLLM